MKHLTEEQIVLHCYGDATDGQAMDRHLDACAECRAEFEKVKALLAEIPPTPVPEPPEYLEQKLWLNLRDKLSGEKSWQRFFSPSEWAISAAVGVLVIAAFLAGLFWPRSQSNTKKPELVQVNPQRVVLVAVGDHLERSQMLLIEVMNADSKDPIDLSHQQELARNLLDDNRLYRQSAQRSGDPEVTRVLDDLERVLVEIANAPPDLSATNAQEIRSRVQSQDLLFKIHVLGERISRPEATPNTTSANQRL